VRDDHPIEELRAALVVAGLVPPQKPTLDRYQRRVDELTASCPSRSGWSCAATCAGR
jgi:hypothetical protein